MRTLVLAASLVVAASQAQALSCMQPQVENSFNDWVESEDTYYIGVGSLRALAPLPEVKSGPLRDQSAPPVSAPFQFSGHLLGPDQQYPYEGTVTVTVSCIASWCGSFPKDGRNGLMALKQGESPSDLSLTMGACPGSIFPADVEATVTACMQAGQCPEG